MPHSTPPSTFPLSRSAVLRNNPQSLHRRLSSTDGGTSPVQATTDIDTAITRANREIELLNEYRTRLIADVVTGKLDVRDAAAALPEVDPLDADDDLDDGLETDADAELDDLDAIPEEAKA